MEDLLQGWIRQASASGVVESEGSFTMDRRRATEKLRAFQLSHPAAWVLKFVQLANSVGVPLRVVQSRKETELVFRGFPGWTQSDILDSLAKLAENKERALSHLAVGVRLLMNSNLAFQLSCSDGYLLVWDGNQLGALDTPDAVDFCIRVPHFEIGKKFWIFNLGTSAARKRQFQVQETFQKLSAFSASEVTLDSLEISGLFHEPTFGVKESRRPLAIGFVEEDSQLPSFEVRGGQIRGFSKIYKRLEQEFERNTIGSHRTKLALITTAFFQNLGHIKRSYLVDSLDEEKGLSPLLQRSELVWVLDGVPVQREALRHEGTIAVLVVISAEGLATDLTTLALRQSDELELRRREAMTAVANWFQQSWSKSEQGRQIETMTSLYSGKAKGESAQELQDLLRMYSEDLADFPFASSLTDPNTA